MSDGTSRERHCVKCGTALAVRHDGERERLTCPADGCGFVLYDNPTPVVAGIVERNGEVILVRAKNFPEKWFGLVTGFLERGERPEEGIVREVFEELGLRPITSADGTTQKPTLVGAYPFFPMNQVIIAYHLEVSGEVKLGDELAAYKSIAIEKVRPWPFGTGEALAEWLTRVRPKG